VRVFGLNWRPLYQLKITAREGLDGFDESAVSMTTFVFYLQTILLWLFTILAGARRILKWAARRLFISPKTSFVEKQRVSARAVAGDALIDIAILSTATVTTITCTCTTATVWAPRAELSSKGRLGKGKAWEI
jgi:hypothetical protein